MLEISDRVLQVFASERMEAFVADLVRILGEELPDEARALGREEVTALVRRTIFRADGWGVDQEGPIGQLCAIALAFGESVFDDANVGAFIAGGASEDRLNALAERLEDG